MRILLITCILSMLAIDVPSTLAALPGKQSVAVRGEIMCGVLPATNARVRLFRVKQGKNDDLNQMLDEKITYKSGMFLLEGNTNSFPLNETNMEPVVSFYHTCDNDIKNVNKTGYRKFDFHVPKDYITLAAKPHRMYNFGKLNLQFVFPGEKRVKKIGEKSTTSSPRKFW